MRVYREVGLVQQASELADRTREDRNRYADFLRVLAIAAVVMGHWLVIDVQLVDGLPVGTNVLTEAPWTHWGTWVFQVIPLFFLVGGYANSVSWRAHRDREEDWASWLRRRSLRLIWPTGLFIAAGLALVPLAVWLGAPEELVSEAAWVVTIILWFLAVYLAVAILTPLAMGAHDRWGTRFIIAMVIAVVAGDAASFLADNEMFALANYPLVWGIFHQIGFTWHQQQLPDKRTTWALAAAAGLALVAVVVWGPYPVSMVGVPGAEVHNTGPPTLALLLFGLTLIGVALALRTRLEPWLERSLAWPFVVGGNLVVMSVFLWHVIPVVMLAAIMSTFGLTLPGEPGTATWLAYRPLWVFMLALLLVPVILLVRRGEHPPPSLESISRRQGHSRLTLSLGLVGIAAMSTGLARLALDGFWVGQPTVIPIWGGLAFFAGAVMTIGSGLLAPEPGRGSG